MLCCRPVCRCGGLRLPPAPCEKPWPGLPSACPSPACSDQRVPRGGGAAGLHLPATGQCHCGGRRIGARWRPGAPQLTQRSLPQCLNKVPAVLCALHLMLAFKLACSYSPGWCPQVSLLFQPGAVAPSLPYLLFAYASNGVSKLLLFDPRGRAPRACPTASPGERQLRPAEHVPLQAVVACCTCWHACPAGLSLPASLACWICLQAPLRAHLRGRCPAGKRLPGGGGAHSGPADQRRRRWAVFGRWCGRDGQESGWLLALLPALASCALATCKPACAACRHHKLPCRCGGHCRQRPARRYGAGAGPADRGGAGGREDQRAGGHRSRQACRCGMGARSPPTPRGRAAPLNPCVQLEFLLPPDSVAAGVPYTIYAWAANLQGEGPACAPPLPLLTLKPAPAPPPALLGCAAARRALLGLGSFAPFPAALQAPPRQPVFLFTHPAGPPSWTCAPPRAPTWC